MTDTPARFMWTLGKITVFVLGVLLAQDIGVRDWRSWVVFYGVALLVFAVRYPGEKNNE